MFTDFDIASRENVKTYDVVEGVKFCTFLRKILKIFQNKKRLPYKSKTATYNTARQGIEFMVDSKWAEWILNSRLGRTAKRNFSQV